MDVQIWVFENEAFMVAIRIRAHPSVHEV